MQEPQTTVSNVTGTVLGFGALAYANAMSLIGAILVAAVPSLVNAAARWLTERSGLRRENARLKAENAELRGIREADLP